MNRGLAIKILIFALIAAMILPAIGKIGGCSPSSNVPTTPTEPRAQKPVVNVDVPTASGDTIYAFTAKQVAFGPRVPNTASHKACKDWIIKKLKSYGVTVEEQNFTEKSYNGITLNGTNIIGKINPGNSRRVMLASHWDTRPFADSDPDLAKRKKSFDSADDGASGVASLLETARLMQKNPCDVGVDLVFFDLEDYGDNNGAPENWCLGSQYWAKTKGNYMARFGVLFDMTGGKNARFDKEAVSMQYAPIITTKLWAIAEELGHANLFVNEKGNAVTDDHYFVNQVGIPMVDIINRNPDGSFGSYHHTTADNLANLDKSTLQSVLQVVLTAVYREGKGVM